MTYSLKKSIFVLFLFMISFFSVLKNIHAQEFQLYSADDIFVETIPDIPGTNELVDIKLESYSFNLNNYYIAWFKDGEKVNAGYGEKELQFRTGKSGEVTDITAVIEFNGQVFRKELQFAPSEVDLLWEAIDSYKPPFYKGKTLALPQSKLKITAIPETLLVEPTDGPNLIYYWDRNYQRNQKNSGFGKQSLEIELDPLLEEERFTVTSNDRRENSFAKNNITISPQTETAKVLFYEINDKGRLMTNRAFNTNTNLDKDTIRLSFHPLHISSIKRNFTDLFVNWSINNEPRPPQDFTRQNELFITTNGTSGKTKIDINLEGIEKILQKTQESFELNFNI